MISVRDTVWTTVESKNWHYIFNNTSSKVLPEIKLIDYNLFANIKRVVR